MISLPSKSQNSNNTTTARKHQRNRCIQIRRATFCPKNMGIAITAITGSESAVERIGMGHCGSVWASKSSIALKREDGGPGRSLVNEHDVHRTLLRAAIGARQLSSSSAQSHQINIPLCPAFSPPTTPRFGLVYCPNCPRPTPLVMPCSPSASLQCQSLLAASSSRSTAPSLYAKAYSPTPRMKTASSAPISAAVAFGPGLRRASRLSV